MSLFQERDQFVFQVWKRMEEEDGMIKQEHDNVNCIHFIVDSTKFTAKLVNRFCWRAGTAFESQQADHGLLHTPGWVMLSLLSASVWKH